MSPPFIFSCPPKISLFLGIYFFPFVQNDEKGGHEHFFSCPPKISLFLGKNIVLGGHEHFFSCPPPSVAVFSHLYALGGHGGHDFPIKNFLKVKKGAKSYKTVTMKGEKTLF